MSKETTEWLNNNTMIGFVAHREKWANNGYVRVDGVTQKVKAWWKSDTFEHAYDDAIPAEEVERVLFNWEPVETQVWNRLPVDQGGEDYDGEDGEGRRFLWVLDDKRKGIMRPDTQEVFNYFTVEGYKVHSYKPWLMDNVTTILDGEAGIASAMLLRGGGVAAVTVELPDGITTDYAGIEIRPSLVAATSLDGTRATIYKLATMIPVCDNSLEDALTGAGKGIKIKHSAKSLGKLGETRDALGLIYQHGEEMAAFLDSLAKVDVTDQTFHDIINHMVVVPEAKVDGGKVSNQRAITIAENKQGELTELWTRDPRSAPFHGTLLGAYQSVNTWNEHFRSNNPNTPERIMTGTLDGKFAKEDQVFWALVGSLAEDGQIDMRPVAELLVN